MVAAFRCAKCCFVDKQPMPYCPACGSKTHKVEYETNEHYLSAREAGMPKGFAYSRRRFDIFTGMPT